MNKQLNPIAVVSGKEVYQFPQSLYVPPHALKVLLNSFEGPLDFLLFLVRRHNIDLLQINIADIARQYLNYINMMRQIQIDIAAEYLIMAAWLTEAKSRLLLPSSHVEQDEEEPDPTQQLIERLQNYQTFKRVGEELNELAREERDTWVLYKIPVKKGFNLVQPQVTLVQLAKSLAKALQRAKLYQQHIISPKALSTSARVAEIIEKLNSPVVLQRNRGLVLFNNLFNYQEGVGGVIVSFIAVLELLKSHLVELVSQGEKLYLRAQKN